MGYYFENWVIILKIGSIFLKMGQHFEDGSILKMGRNFENQAEFLKSGEILKVGRF